jgi:hypothetical protein
MNIFKNIYNIIYNILLKNNKKSCGNIVEVDRINKLDKTTIVHLKIEENK